MSMEAGQASQPPLSGSNPQLGVQRKATALRDPRGRLPKHTLGCLAFIHTTRSGGWGQVLYGVTHLEKARHASFNNAILPLGLRQSSAPATGWEVCLFSPV